MASPYYGCSGRAHLPSGSAAIHRLQYSSPLWHKAADHILICEVVFGLKRTRLADAPIQSQVSSLGRTTLAALCGAMMSGP